MHNRKGESYEQKGQMCGHVSHSVAIHKYCHMQCGDTACGAGE